MTAVTIDRPSDAKPVSRPRSRKPATVSASALTLHLDCARAYISKLEAEGVIQRQGDGFPLDQSGVAYLRYLRRERQQSPRAAAYAEHALAKAALLRIRIEEKQRTLVRRDAVDELIDQIAGTVLTHLSGMSARCSRDMVVRRNIDGVVMQIRRGGRMQRAAAQRTMSDLDGLRDMLEAVAVSRETDAKIKGTVPPVGAAWGAGGTVQVPDTATRSH